MSRGVKYDPSQVAREIDDFSAQRAEFEDDDHHRNSTNLGGGGGGERDPLAGSAPSQFVIVDDDDDQQEQHGRTGGGAQAVPTDEEHEILDPKLHGSSSSSATGGIGRICLKVLLAVGGFILIIVISMAIAKAASIKGKGGGGSNKSSLAPTLPPPPADLNATCNAADIAANRDQFMQCEIDCQPAECCDYPTVLDLSCLKGQEDVCMNYHKSCTNLVPAAPNSSTTLSKIPKAPADLPRMCSPSSLKENVGVRTCAKYCLPVECCWEEGVKSCADDANCAAFAPCFHLRSMDTADDQVAQAVSATCAPTNIATAAGRADCRAICTSARCCFQNVTAAGDQAGLGVLGCPLESMDEAYCQQYQPCIPVMMGTTGDASQADDDDALWDDDDKYFDDDDDVLDFDDDSLIADHLPKLPHGIDIACDPDLVTVDPSHMVQCANYCRPAKCCTLPASNEKSCLGDKAELCEDYYKWCAILLNPDGIRPESLGPHQVPNVDEKKVTDACGIESLSTQNGYSACQKFCLSAECCWNETATKQCQTNKLCPKYTGCFNFKALTTINPVISESITATCAADKVATAAGYNLCDQLCSQHKCCYTANMTCSFSNPAVCEQYTGCSVLTQTSSLQGFAQLPPFDFNLVATCRDSTNPQAKQDCEESCLKATCCEVPENLENSCLKQNHEDCLDYHMACSTLLYGNQQATNAVVPDADPTLPDLCSPESLATDLGFKRCVKQCTPGRCCYATDLNTTAGELPCVDSQKEKCQQYAPCLGLQAGATVNTDIATQVTETCTAESVKTPQGEVLCRAACEQHKCCWEPQATQSPAGGGGRQRQTKQQQQQQRGGGKRKHKQRSRRHLTAEQKQQQQHQKKKLRLGGRRTAHKHHISKQPQPQPQELENTDEDVVYNDNNMVERKLQDDATTYDDDDDAGDDATTYDDDNTGDDEYDDDDDDDGYWKDDDDDDTYDDDTYDDDYDDDDDDDAYDPDDDDTTVNIKDSTIATCFDAAVCALYDGCALLAKVP